MYLWYSLVFRQYIVTNALASTLGVMRTLLPSVLIPFALPPASTPGVNSVQCNAQECGQAVSPYRELQFMIWWNCLPTFLSNHKPWSWTTASLLPIGSKEAVVHDSILKSYWTPKKKIYNGNQRRMCDLARVFSLMYYSSSMMTVIEVWMIIFTGSSSNVAMRKILLDLLNFYWQKDDKNWISHKSARRRTLSPIEFLKADVSGIATEHSLELFQLYPLCHQISLQYES